MKEKKRTNFFKEFSAFVNRGNVIDLAVGIIIGGAFQKIVSSFVADIVMPIIGLILGGINIADAKFVLREAIMDGDTVVKSAVTFNYGNFLQTVLDFLVIALVVFVMVRGINRLRKGIDDMGRDAKEKLEAALKKQSDEDKAAEEAKAKEQAEAKAKAEAEEAKAKAQAEAAKKAASQEELLAEILKELKKLNKEN